MSDIRFFVDPEAIVDDEVLLSGELMHYVGTVLRLRAGDEVVILDGRGNHFRSRIETVGKGDGRARILERWSAGEESLPLRLLQALPKGDKFDLVLQKGTELGISRFSPVWSERSIAPADRQRFAHRHRRWQRIVAEAARQSRRPLLPECDAPSALPAALRDCREELKLILWEDGGVPLRDALPAARPAGAAILVGPEGGFSAREVELATAAGFRPVGLGPRILRTETAGFAVTAVLEYVYGDFGSSLRAGP